MCMQMSLCAEGHLSPIHHNMCPVMILRKGNERRMDDDADDDGEEEVLLPDGPAAQNIHQST